MPCFLNNPLFISYSNHLEKTYNFSPLSAKIQAYMIINSDMDGYSFEELLSVFKVSKSSLSTSLNLLLSLNKLETITKEDSRKRYFRINLNYLPEKLVFLFDLISEDLHFAKLIYDFKENNDGLTNFEKNGMFKIYLQYLEESKAILEQTINKINDKKIENIKNEEY